jgi:8-oxo-dGTP pyrophosphatase MutT (NUDIX family)
VPLEFRYELRRSREAIELWARLYGPDIDSVPEECFAAEGPPSSDPVLTPLEHDDYRWCSFEEAEALLKWDDNRAALRVLRETLS